MVTMMTFMGQFLGRSLAQKNLTGAPVDTEDIKAVNNLWLRIGHGGQGRTALNLDACFGNGFGAGLHTRGLG